MKKHGAKATHIHTKLPASHSQNELSTQNELYGQRDLFSLPFACLQCVCHLSTSTAVNHEPSKYSSGF